MSRKHIRTFMLLLVLVAAGPLFAGAPDCTGISGVYNTDPILDGELTTVRLAQGLDNPVFVTAAPGDNERLFVLEQTGAIRLIKNGVLQATPFIDLDPIVTGGVTGERGLLGLAFDPDYQNSGYFFVYYTTVSGGGAGNGDIVVARYERDAIDPDLGDDSTGQIVISVPHPISNHNGGTVAFGPDGYLYLAIGDGGNGCDPGSFPGNAQKLTVNLGKMLRLDPLGTEGGAPDCDGIGGNYKITPWTRQQQLREKAVYLRTTEGEICRTECRSLGELSAVLDPNRFAPIHRSLLVNMRKICNIVPGWVTFVDLAVKGRTESLKTSRRLLPSLRERLGLRSRRRRKLPRADRPIHSPRRRSLRGQTRSPRDASPAVTPTRKPTTP